MAVNIGKLLLKAAKQNAKTLGVRTATLSREVAGTRTGGSLSAGTQPSTSSWPCKALIEVATSDNIPATLVGQAERKIGIFGASLPAGVIPKAEDKITMLDIDGTTKTLRLIAPVAGDGVGAFFEFAAR